MKAYIQSKSGDFNTELDLPVASIVTPMEFMKFLRAQGSYYANNHRGQQVIVPFEEIQCIRIIREVANAE